MIVSRYNSRAVVAAVSVVVVLLGCLCPETNAGRAQYSVATATTTVAARDSSPLRRRGGSLSSERRPASGWGGRYATPVQKPPPQSWYRSSSPSAATTSRTKLTVQEEEEEDRQRQQQEAKEAMEAFLTRDSRNSFIARVYAILAGQLLVTAATIVLFGTNPAWTAWMQRPGMGAAVPVVSLLLSTVAWIIMCVSPQARRANPVKWQLLALFTLGEAISVGFVSSFYQFHSVVSAMMATALATTGISFYTINQKNSKFDLSQWGATLSSFGLFFVVYGLIQILQMVGVLPTGFLPYNDMIYGLVGATLFSCYLAYHTKLIVAGKHSKYQMNEKDYIFGAMTLYNDIINLFIYLLRVVGEDRKK